MKCQITLDIDIVIQILYILLTRKSKKSMDSGCGSLKNYKPIVVLFVMFTQFNNTVVYFKVFQAVPPLPPSPAQAVQRNSESTGFISSVKRLVANPGFLLLLVTYGMNVGSFYAISTLLNQIVLRYFQVRIKLEFSI